MQAMRQKKDEAERDIYSQGLRIATLERSLEERRRECDALRGSHAESLKIARADFHAELATVRRGTNEARRAAAQSAVLQRQAERDVRVCVVDLFRVYLGPE
jgi:hypothetical protein